MKKYKKIYLEITNVCNLACHFCPPTKRQAQFMDIELFKSILDEIKPYTDYLYFHVKGEPLLHPKIDILLELCDEQGFKVNITTNGTLINQVKDKIINKPALRQINFSLHSLSQNERFSNQSDYLYHILTLVKEVTEKRDLIISLRLWNLDQDNEVNLEQKVNRETLETIEKEFNLPFKIEEKVTPGTGVKLGKNIYLNQESQFVWPDINTEPNDDQGFCYGLRDQVAILVDGTVVPCCLDGEGIINLGNIKEKHFSEIITSDRAMNIYKGFSNRKVVEDLCKKCIYRKRRE